MSDFNGGERLPDAVIFGRGENSDEEWQQKLAELGRVASELGIEPDFSYPEVEDDFIIDRPDFLIAAHELGNSSAHGSGNRAYNILVRKFCMGTDPSEDPSLGLPKIRFRKYKTYEGDWGKVIIKAPCDLEFSSFKAFVDAIDAFYGRIPEVKRRDYGKIGLQVGPAVVEVWRKVRDMKDPAKNLCE